MYRALLPGRSSLLALGMPQMYTLTWLVAPSASGMLMRTKSGARIISIADLRLRMQLR